MNPAPLLHGAAGSLDELLACGVGLACILVTVFVLGLRGAKDKPVDVGTANNENTRKV